MADLVEEAWPCNALLKISSPASRRWLQRDGEGLRRGRRFAVGLRREQARRTHDDQGLIG